MVFCGILLGTTAGWALTKTLDSHTWICGVFIIMILHSVTAFMTFLGILGKIPIYVHTAFIAEVVHIPLLNAELYHKMGMEKVAYGHAASCIVPFFSLYILGDRYPGLTDIFDIVNTASLLYLALSKKNEWCGFIAVNHVVFRMYGYYSAMKLALLSMGLTIFNVLAVNCVTEAIAGEAIAGEPIVPEVMNSINQ